MIHTPGESFEAHENVASVSVGPDTAAVTIPDAHFLFTADFKRKGPDLVLTGDDGHKIFVPDYFRHEKQPDLVSPEGALLSASLVELLSGSATPGQYAQAAAPAAQQPVGRVETVSGSATVTRNGVAVDLNVGDLVFQGDVVQTRSDSTLGIGFADGSAFSLKENARMALNEFVYDPNGTANSALINLVQGTVSFIASQVAKTGNMRVDTPTATLGIRGTFVTVDVSSVDGHTVASLGLETNLTTGEQFAGAFTLTNRITGNAVNVSSVNSMFSVSPNGTIGESAKPVAVHAIEQASFQALSAIAAATAAGMGTGPTGPSLNLNATPDIPSGPGNSPAPGGSSGPSSAPTNTSPVDNHPTTLTLTTTPVNTPPANTDPTNIPINTNQPNTLPLVNPTNTPLAVNTPSDIKPIVVVTDTPKTETPTSQPAVNNPATITSASATGSFSERANTTNDTTDKDQASGTIAFADPDLSDTHTVTQGAPTFTWSGGTLSAGQQAALAAAGTLELTTTDSTSSGAGSVAWTHKITDSALDFLAAGETLTATYNVTINDGHGGTVTQPVTVTATGTNDVPVINGGPIIAAVQEDVTTRVTGQLTATDPDQTDAQTWSIVGASPTHAPGYQFKIDEFKIIKNEGLFFRDTFSDNNPPPSAPTGFGNISSYTVTGTISESGGRAILDGSNAGFGTGSSAGDPFFGQYATLNTNIDPTNTTLGLKDNSSFTVSGLFDLTLPAEDRNEYGIRLSDRTSSQAGDSTVELRVARGADGIERVQLREIDFGSHTSMLLQSFTLNPGSHDQILLSLTNDSENTGVIHASFELEQGGVLDSSTLTNFTQTGTIFSGENWTRAQFFAEAPAQSDSVLQGTYGQLDITQAGAWTYQLANGQTNVQALTAGQIVTDTFTAQVADGHGGFDTKTITVNVTGTNDAPTPVANIVAVNEDATASAATRSAGVLGNDTDPDTGETSTLVVSAIRAGTSGPVTAVTAGPANVNGTYGTLTIYSNGTYSYTPNNAAAEALSQGTLRSDVFTYTAKDVQGATATATLTFNITGQNDAPVAVADVAAATEDALPNTVNGNVLTNDTDVDVVGVGDTHTVTALRFVTSETNGIDNGTTITAVGTYGTLVVTKATGGYTYTLDNSKPSVQALADGQQVTDVFTYTNSDNHDGSSQSTLTVTVTGANDAPTLAAVTGPTYTDTSAFDNFSAASGTLVGSDVDNGATLTYGISAGTIGCFMVGAATYDVSKAGTYGTLYVNSSTGAYTFVPNDTAINALTASTTENFTCTVSDGTLSAQQTFTVTLNGADDAPTAPSDTDSADNNVVAQAENGTSVGITAYSTDSDQGDTVTYQFASNGNPDNLFAIDLNTGVVTVADSAHLNAGTYTIGVEAVDNHNVAGPASSFVVTVTGGDLEGTLSGLTSNNSVENTAVAVGSLTDDGADVLSAATYSWQVFRNDVWFQEGNQSSFTASAADFGYQLRVVISYSDDTLTLSAGTVQENPNEDVASSGGNWSQSQTWSAGVSNATTDVVLEGATQGVTLNDTGYAHSLSVEGSSTFRNDGTLVVSAAVTVLDGTFNLHGVLQTGSLTGTITDIGSGGTIEGTDGANSWAEVITSATISASGTIDGWLAIDSGATLTLSGTGTHAEKVTFLNNFPDNGLYTGTLVLETSYSGSVCGFTGTETQSDAIDLKYVGYNVNLTPDYNTTTHVLSIMNGGTTVTTLTLLGDYQSSNFKLSGDETHLLIEDPPADSGTPTVDSGTGTTATAVATDTNATTVSGSTSTDLALTVTASLTTQDGTADQFAFQSDSQSGTLAGDSTLAASGQDASTTDATTLDASASTDNQPTATATAAADTGLASTVATTPQSATTDSATSGTQAGATTQTASAAPAVTGVNGDTFVFAANFGHETIANFHPDTDVIEIDHTVFADFQALLAATHDDGNGNAVIAANPNETITVKNVTVAQLVQHQSDFHFT